MKNLTVCFTGRRPKDLCGYNWDNYTDFQSKLVDYIVMLYNKGVKTFITGGAQGFDQMAFWAINSAKTICPYIKNIVYVPHRSQPDAWRGKASDAFSKSEYFNMLDTADDVKFIVDAKLVDYKQICKALADRNHQMVNSSDFVIALYPTDDWNNVKGGTAECMRYASSVKKPIRQIVYHIDSTDKRLIFDLVKNV